MSLQRLAPCVTSIAFLLCTWTSVLATEKPTKKLQVFILAGQSNMQGHAKVSTFDYIGDDPTTAPLLKLMVDPAGKPRVCDKVRISYLTGIGDDNGEVFGDLTAGYGARRNPQQDDGKIGPEFTFGITMEKEIDGPVLIIKTAWGGKSLYYDFRPPSAGPYQRTKRDIERNRNSVEKSGLYYRLMINHVQKVLRDIKRVCPEYVETQGFDIAGFVWFQGWNDMVNRDVYPRNSKPTTTNRFGQYSEWMADFIRDVRQDLDAPKMPFVIGVMGVGGDKPNPNNLEFRKAMAAPAALPEFQGNVIAIETAAFWDARLGTIVDKYGKVRQMGHLLRTKNKNHANKDGSMSPKDQKEFLKRFEADLISPEEVALRQRGSSNAGYHYLGCAKTFAQMGQTFAKAILKMNTTRDSNR